MTNDGAGLTNGARVWRIAAALALAAALQFAIVFIARAAGWSSVNYLAMEPDLFGDYLKIALALPGAEAVRGGDLFGIGHIVAWYRDVPADSGLAALRAGQLNHMQVPPLPMLFCLLTTRAMAVVDPGLLYLLCLLALAAAWGGIVHRWSRDAQAGPALAWWLAGLLCYPAAMVAVRGNVHAGAAGLMLIAAMLLLARRRRPLAATALVALACCIRPNAAVFALPLLALVPPASWPRALTVAVLIGAGVSAGALLATQALYPDYSIAAFLASVKLYYGFYVVGDLGMAYGSSVYGALRMLFGFQPGLDRLALLPGAACFAAIVALLATGGLRTPALLFLTLCGYALASTVFADYHLLPILAPLMILVREARGRRLDQTEGHLLIAAVLLLAPKNAAFPDSGSWQVVLNPAIMIWGAAHVATGEWRRIPRLSPAAALARLTRQIRPASGLDGSA